MTQAVAGDTLADDVVFELRTDPTTGRRVLIAEGRALRPNDFNGIASPPIADHSANCPFCRGNEHHTPHELAVVNDAAGNWQVRVVPNKYPAVGVPASAGSSPTDRDMLDRLKPGLQQGLQLAASPLGVHEVIIESPRHVRDWHDLASDELAVVLQTFRDRIEHAYSAHQMHSALVFKNVGHEAGASLEHVHTQLVAFPYVPEVLEREVQIAAEHHRRTGSCLMCQLLAEERQAGTRLVCENDCFAAFTAFAGRQPYESWIVPRRHASCLTHLGNEESHSLAIILGDLIGRLRSAGDLRAPLAYNVVLHTAPVGDDREKSFHWHWEVIPRTTSLAGFEWGTGMYINSVSPERAAIRMRMSKPGKILPIQ
jgi:UDPglucose--hexose-1-phosphate uridylyltransferase